MPGPLCRKPQISEGCQCNFLAFQRLRIVEDPEKQFRVRTHAVAVQRGRGRAHMRAARGPARLPVTSLFTGNLVRPLAGRAAAGSAACALTLNGYPGNALNMLIRVRG